MAFFIPLTTISRTVMPTIDEIINNISIGSSPSGTSLQQLIDRTAIEEAGIDPAKTVSYSDIPKPPAPPYRGPLPREVPFTRDTPGFSIPKNISPLVNTAYNSLGKEKAYSEGVFKPLLASVMAVESSYNPEATSHKGARGLMQVMPATAKEVGSRYGIEVNDENLYDPETNVKIGTAYLNQLIKEFKGDIKLALAGYNGGPNRVRRLLKETGGSTFEEISDLLPKETRNYVPKVLNRFKKFQT